MADPLNLDDLNGHTGPGCGHSKETAVLLAVRDWFLTPAILNALKTALSTAAPGVDWTTARAAKAVRKAAEEL